MSELDEALGISTEATPPPLHVARPALPSSGPPAVGFLPVLRVPDFRLLWAAQAACQLGDKFLMFALLITLFALTGRSSTQSLLLLAYTLPSVLLSAPAGVYADRHDKRQLMIGTNLLRAGLVLLIPLSLSVPYLRGQAWPLIVVTLLFSAVGQVFAPSEAASIPFLVRREQIMAATSLFMTTVIVSLVTGVPAATVAYKLGGAHLPFFIAAGLFAVAALCIWRVGTSLRAAMHAHAPTANVLRELREGAAILGGAPALRLALGQVTLALVVVFTMFALGPAYMSRVIGRPPEDTYLVLIPATLGLVGTAVVLGRLGPRLSRARTLVRSSIGGGVTLVLIGLLPGAIIRSGHDVLLTPVAVVLSTTFGAAIGALLIPAFTVLQEGTDERSRGRIFGGIFTVINASVALPLLLAGSLADAYGVDRVVTGLGVLLAACGAATRLAGGSRLHALEAERLGS